MLKLASRLVAERHSYVPKVGLLCQFGKAACRLAVGGLPQLFNKVPPSDVCRGGLECHASFNKLVLELVEVKVHGSGGIGRHHQQLVVGVII
jgi:hypothetical protein